MVDTGRMTDEPTEITPATPASLLPSHVELPSGGSAVFCHEHELSGKDVRTIRLALDQAGNGSIANDIHSRALIAIIREWTLPYQPGAPIPSMYKTPQTMLDLLRWDDLRALERAVEEFIKTLTGEDKPDDGAPGSPPRPASD